MPKGCFAVAKHPAKLDFLRFGDLAAISQLRNKGTMLRNGTRVPRGGFLQLRKFSQRGAWGYEMIS